MPRDPYTRPSPANYIIYYLTPYSLFKITARKNNELVWADSVASMHRVHCTRRMMHSCLQEGQWLTRTVCTLHNLCLYNDCGRCLMPATSPCLYEIIQTLKRTLNSRMQCNCFIIFYLESNVLAVMSAEKHDSVPITEALGNRCQTKLALISKIILTILRILVLK